MPIHPAAFKHGIERGAIEHALRHPLVMIGLDPEDDPQRVLTIGPDQSGVLLEVVSLTLEDGSLVIHAMRLRPSYRRLLPPGAIHND